MSDDKIRVLKSKGTATVQSLTPLYGLANSPPIRHEIALEERVDLQRGDLLFLHKPPPKGATDE